MIRKIITIDQEKCVGCGLCAKACQEGAIGLVNGKAQLLRDDYCDGLGNCLPVCPTGAIRFEQREAAAYNKAATQEHKAASKAPENTLACGCPSSQARALKKSASASDKTPSSVEAPNVLSQLQQWPVQMKLVPVNAPYFDNASLLIAADCSAFAYGNFHEDFMKNNVTIIGCPKLDEEDYSEKLTAILSVNNIRSLTVVRMEVPCCSGLENAVKTALLNSGKIIPLKVVTLSVEGKIL